MAEETKDAVAQAVAELQKAALLLDDSDYPVTANNVTRAVALLTESAKDAERLDAIESGWYMLSWHFSGECEVIVPAMSKIIGRGENPLLGLRFKKETLREAIDAAKEKDHG